MNDPMKLLDEMIEDVKDSNAAIDRSKSGGYVETCGCGALTLAAPCPKCRRELETETRKGQSK